MSRTLLISDTHFGNLPEFATYESGFNSRLELQLKAFAEILDWSRAKKCERMIHLGDVFHFRGQVPPEVVNRVKSVIADHGKHLEDKLLLTGNHDITVEGPWYNNAQVLAGFMGIEVVSRPMRSAAYPDEIYIPFTKRDFKTEVIPAVLQMSDPRISPITTAFIHQSVFGAQYNKTIQSGVQPGLLNKHFKWTFAGHIHYGQTSGDIFIVGAPWPLTFGDTGRYRACIMDDKTKHIVDECQPPHPRFITTRDPEAPRKDPYNFYRLEGVADNGVHNGPNVKVVPEVKTRKLVRVKARSDVELLEAYCRKRGVPTKDIPRLVAEGMRFINQAEK